MNQGKDNVKVNMVEDRSKEKGFFTEIPKRILGLLGGGGGGGGGKKQ